MTNDAPTAPNGDPPPSSDAVSTPDADAEPTPDAYVVFQSEISQQTAGVLYAEMGRLATYGARRITLLLSTAGGSVMAGLNMYQILRAVPFELTVYNAGSVNSIGNAVFLAGERRYAVPHSTFLFHGVGFNVERGDRFEEKILRERLGSIQADQKKIGAVIAERTSLDEEDIAALFLQQSTKDADYARAVGIIHDVRELKLTPGVPISQFVFQR